VEERFASQPSWVPDLIILHGYFRPTDELSHYFVEGRRSEGLIAGLLPVMDPVECGHTAHLEDAIIAVRVLRDGPPLSGVCIIGRVYRGAREGRMPVPGVKVLITGPSGSRVSMTDAQGVYDVIGLPPGEYTVQIAGNNRHGVYAAHLREGGVHDSTFYLD